jgi:DNA repair protein RadD
MIELREYQRKAVGAIYTSFRAGTQAPLIVMPTGSGKAPTLCTFIKDALAQWPETRMLMLVHSRELVDQNYKTMLRIWPEAPVSVYSAGLRSRDLSGQIVFGSIQSLYRKAYDLQKVDLIIIDEAHLIPASGDGMYRRLMADLATISGGPVPMVGFTATGFRMSSGSLVEGTGRVFDSIAHEVGLLELIDSGYLAPPITKATATRIETKGIATRAGEFALGQLQAAADRAEITEAACDEIVAAGRDRRSWLVFCTGVDHAFHVRDALKARGISCETVTGETPLGERDRMIRAHKNGMVKCLTNDSCLTTGYDNPILDLLAVLRPTQSPGLWVQMVGRGTRPAEGKTDCLVLDFGQNGMRHGPLDQIKGRVKGDKGVAPCKECPECQSIIPAGLAQCPACGHEFPAPDMAEKLHDRAIESAVLSSEVATSDWLPVSRVSYHEHRKPGGLPTLRADYHCGLARYSEWVCLEHDGFARQKAVKWWRERWGNEVPATVREALDVSEWTRAPQAIRIRPDGKYFRVIGYQW